MYSSISTDVNITNIVIIHSGSQSRAHNQIFMAIQKVSRVRVLIYYMIKKIESIIMVNEAISIGIKFWRLKWQLSVERQLYVHFCFSQVLQPIPFRTLVEDTMPTVALPFMSLFQTIKQHVILVWQLHSSNLEQIRTPNPLTFYCHYQLKGLQKLMFINARDSMISFNSWMIIVGRKYQVFPVILTLAKLSCLQNMLLNIKCVFVSNLHQHLFYF